MALLAEFDRQKDNYRQESEDYDRYTDMERNSDKEKEDREDNNEQNKDLNKEKISNNSNFTINGNWRLVNSDNENSDNNKDDWWSDWDREEGKEGKNTEDEENKDDAEGRIRNKQGAAGNQLEGNKSCQRHQFLTGVQYILNSAILFTREHIKAGGKLGVPSDYIRNSTIERLAHVAPATLTRAVYPDNKFTEEDLQKYAKKITTFGASGKRSKEQTLAAAASTANIVKKLPKNSIQAWTDGSKLGKGPKGPTGAGAMIIHTDNLSTSHHLTYHLGESTNQAAELWAIGGALETIRNDKIESNTEIHIFSDSDFSIKCLTGIYNSKVHYNIIKHIANLIDYFPRNSVHFHHVAGHAGIMGNDIADALANKGAQRSKLATSNMDLPFIARTYGFNHQLVRDDHYGVITEHCNSSSNRSSVNNTSSFHFTSYM